MWICTLEDDFCPSFACVSWLNYDNLFCNILCYVRYLRVHCCLLHADAWEGSYVLLDMGKFKVLSIYISIYIYIFCHGAQYKNVICMFVMRNRPPGKMFELLKQMCIWRYLFCFYSILFFTRRKPNQTGKQSCSVLYSTKMDFTDASKTSIGFEILFWCRLTAIHLSIIVYHYF